MDGKIANRINSVVYTILVFLVIAMVYYIASRHPLRYDMTKEKIRSLSSQTMNVLGGLDKDVEIIAFMPPDAGGVESVDDLLKEYEKRSERIHYKIEDPVRNPVKFQEFGMKDYGVVFVSGDSRKIVGPEELYEYGYSPQYGEQVPQAFKGEQAFTNAIVSVTSSGRKNLCFTEGHMERNIFGEESVDYAGIKDLLEGENYKIKTFNPALDKEIPGDCTVVLVLGAERFFSTPEKKLLEDYLDGGGRAMFLLDPTAKSGLEPMVARWGVHVGSDMIVDRARYFADDMLSPVPELSSHEITRELSRSRLTVVLFRARSVMESDGIANGVSVTPLLTSSESSWAETEPEGDSISLDPEKDITGPVSMGVAVSMLIGKDQEEGGEGDDSENAAEMRMVILGDADFASNGFVYQDYLLTAIIGETGNTDLFMNSVNWLAGEEDLIAIRPKPADFRPLEMTGNRPFYIFILFVFVIPAAIIFIGISIWFRRRSL